MESLQLGDPRRTPRKRPIYSCHNRFGQRGCFIEDQGVIADVTAIVRRSWSRVGSGIKKPACIS